MPATQALTADRRLLERSEVVARTVISQQPFYASAACTANQRQLLETMVGAALWYLPQSDDLWTGCLSTGALQALAAAPQPKAVKLTKDHHYPRKVAAAELFAIQWQQLPDPAQEVCSRYLQVYGRFNYVLPEENKRLVKYQKTHAFVSPEQAYQQAGIDLHQLSRPLLKAILAGEHELAELALSGAID
jgi:hypothetical protein